MDDLFSISGKGHFSFISKIFVHCRIELHSLISNLLGDPGGILEMGEVKLLKRQSRIWNYSEYIQVKMDLLNIQMEIRFLVSK